MIQPTLPLAHKTTSLLHQFAAHAHHSLFNLAGCGGGGGALGQLAQVNTMVLIYVP